MSTPMVGGLDITGRDGPALQQYRSRPFDRVVADACSGSGLAAVGASGIGSDIVVGRSRGAVR